MEKNPEVRLIDVSSEDDCLISSSTTSSGFLGNQNDHEYFQLSTELTKGMERKHQFVLSQSSQPQTGKCNLRKSLAWDNAFFTSAGVLEPEELSIINRGLNKADLHPLPGIEEDIRRSVESNSTLDTDNLTLESLEVALFEDVRASIQRSTNTTYSRSQAGPQECGVQSSRKMEFASRNNMKSMLASKRQTTNTQGLERTKKESENTKKEAEKTKREALGTKKEVSVLPRAVQAAAIAGELSTLSLRTSLLRPPKIAGRVNPAPTSPNKRTSLGVNRVKIQNNNVKSSIGRRETLGSLKRPVFGDPSAISRSTPSPKSSSNSSVSSTRVELAASCSSHNRSGSTSSDSTGKSPISSLRNKTKSRNVNLPSSTLKPPLRISSKNRPETGSSRVSAYLMSVSKLSSSISPASSLDGWSSESSSSTSVNQHSNSSTKNLDISSPRKEFYLERGASQSDMQKHQQDQRCVEQKRTGLPSPCSKKTMSGAGSLARPVATGISRSSKPSGLRMPSPKIGFFDAEKSTEPTHTGSSQFHPGVRSAIPKHGVGVGSLIRAKPGKLQPAKSMSGRSSINCDSQLAGVSRCASSTTPICPAPAQKLSNASPKVSTTKTSRGICPNITSPPQNDGRPVIGSHLMTAEGEMYNTSRKKLGSSLNEGENNGQDDFVYDMDTASEQEYATKTTRENSSGTTSELQNDMHHSTAIESHLKTREVGGSSNTEEECLSSFLNEVGNNGQYSFVNYVGTTSEQVYATKITSENSPDITSKLQNDMCHSSAIESHLKTKDVGGSTKTERECISSFLNEGQNNDQYFFVNDIGIVSEKLSATKATRENQGITSGQNDLYHRTGSESHLKTGEMRELMKTESGSLFPKEGEDCCQDAFVNDIDSLSEKHLHISSIMETSTNDLPQISCSPSSGCSNYNNKTASSKLGENIVHGPGHLESNSSSCHDSNEKENSLCYGNQVDGFSRYMGSIDLNMEETTGKKGSSISQFDGMTDNPEGTKSLLSNSREAFVHGQDDFPKVLLKGTTHPLSPNSIDILPITRTPLAVKLSMCSETGSSEFASESATEKLSSYSIITEGVQTENN